MKTNAIFTRTNDKKGFDFTVFLKGEQYKTAKKLALANKGEIGTTTDGLFKATFTSVKNANAFAKDFNAWYDTSKTTIQAPTPRTQNTAPTHAKGKALKDYTVKELEAELRTRKNATNAPNKGKGKAKKPTLDEFIKANPLCSRNDALAYGFKGTRGEFGAYKCKLLGR